MSTMQQSSAQSTAIDCVFTAADRFSVAPMVDVTNSAFRRFARLLCQDCMLYTEMIAANAIVHGAIGLLDYQTYEQPLTLQLGGNEPQILAQSCKIAAKRGFAAINLNAGCPSDKVQQGQFGAVLMKDLDLLEHCLAAMVDAVELPVSIKTRIGVDDLESFEYSCQLLERIMKTGCRHVILHARKCILKGLSPKQNRSVPPLDYERVYSLKRLYPQLHITINGGITSLDEVHEHLAQVDGVMLGRKIIDDPYFLAHIQHSLFTPDKPLPQRCEIFAQILELAKVFLAQGHRLNHLGVHLLNLFNGQSGARAYRRYLSEHMTRPQAGLEVLEQAYACIRSEHGT